MAEQMETFEREFARLYGVKYGIASTSSTAAIHVALGSINPDPCSEVITGPISDIGTVAPIIFQCIPIFADIELKTFGLDPADAERRITDRTMAVIAVHLFG